MAQRITDLGTPPIVGKDYLVPTVQYRWLVGGLRKNRPVFPTRHTDVEHLNFPWPHYHVDPRFISAGDWAFLERRYGDAFAQCQRAPLQRLSEQAVRNGHGPRARERPEFGEADTEPHGPIVWRKRRCMRADIDYRHGQASAVVEMRRAYAGQKCRSNKAGWICPHKNYPLGSHAPDERGVITCPLHGLRIEAASGVVLAPEVRPAPTFGEALTDRYDRLPRDPKTGRPVI